MEIRPGFPLILQAFSSLDSLSHFDCVTAVESSLYSSMSALFSSVFCSGL